MTEPHRLQTEEKRAFVAQLRHLAACQGVGIVDEYGHPNVRLGEGDAILVEMLADYFDRTSAEDDAPGAQLWCYLFSRRVAAAFWAFRRDPAYAEQRKRYRAETQSDIPNLVHLHDVPSRRQVVIERLRYLVASLTPTRPFVSANLVTYLQAEDHVLDQAWHRFVAVAFPAVVDKVAKGDGDWTAKFGQMRLRVHVYGSNLCFAFSRFHFDNQSSVAYHATRDDPSGIRSGRDFTHTPLETCVQMIEVVTRRWSLAKLVRERAA